MPRIIPIRDLRDTGKISEMCNASREPIYITKNGYGDMVIMSMALYEERLAQLEMRPSLKCVRRYWPEKLRQIRVSC